MTSVIAIASSSSSSKMRQNLKVFGLTVLVGGLFVGMLAILWFTQTPEGSPIAQLLQSLFAMNTVQAWWYITRAAGLTSYFLLWLSMVWGIAISTKLFQPNVGITYSYDFHEYLSLLGLGFVLLHIIVLLFDQFLPFSLWQILVPFTGTYRPLWVGLGIIGAYLFLLVTVTFYMRKSIGLNAFRGIHMLSLVGYLGATLHGFFAGTDSALPVTRILYVGTFLIVVFLILYWLIVSALSKREQAAAISRSALSKRRSSGFNARQR
jgi:predicted ferric reductase